VRPHSSVFVAVDSISPFDYRSPSAPSGEGPRLFTAFWRRLFHGVRRLRQRPEWADFAGADWPDRVMAEPVTDRLHAKQGRTIARWTLSRGDRRLVVYLKRHYKLPWLHALLATIWPSGAWSPDFQEWDHLEWARSAGVPTPRAAAAAEYIGPWGRLQSFIAVEELTGMLALHEAVPAAAARLPPADLRRWKRGLIAEMVSIVHRLHDRRRFHKDLYLCHFFIHEADTRRTPDWRGRVRLIDFHRLGRHAWTWPWWQVKDLAQLLYSADVPGVSSRDCVFFWCRFRGEKRRGWTTRWMEWWMRSKARRYARHQSPDEPKATARER
jgi:hypothetical protein